MLPLAVWHSTAQSAATSPSPSLPRWRHLQGAAACGGHRAGGGAGCFHAVRSLPRQRPQVQCKGEGRKIRAAETAGQGKDGRASQRSGSKGRLAAIIGSLPTAHPPVLSPLTCSYANNPLKFVAMTVELSLGSGVLAALGVRFPRYSCERKGCEAVLVEAERCWGVGYRRGWWLLCCKALCGGARGYRPPNCLPACLIPLSSSPSFPCRCVHHWHCHPSAHRPTWLPH